jgi:putative endopeptidase
MKNNLIQFLSLVGLFVYVSCSSIHTVDPLLTHIDSTIKPGDDFFLYANGKWFKENPIPPSESSNGLWQLVQDTINSQIKNICISSSETKNQESGSNKQKIGDFYFSGMDSISLNRKGIADLKPYLDQIDSINDMNGLFKATALVHKIAGAPMFGFFVGQDDKNSSKYAVNIFQGGLSLPDRSYYFDKDKRAVSIREKFQVYVYKIFRIIGYDDPKAKLASEHLIKLETSLAGSSRELKDVRNPLKNYNKFSLEQLEKITPNINWQLFVSETGIQDLDSVIVGQPEFLKSLNNYVAQFSLADWKNYLKFQLTNNMADYMDDRTFMEYFNFYFKELFGYEAPKPRWKRVVEQTDFSLGDLVGQVYKDEYLPKGTKEKLTEIGKAVKKVYAKRISELDWMSSDTKKRALKKLDAVIMKIGYPDKWKDMSSLKIDSLSYLNNVISANKWAFNFSISRFGKPVDRTLWVMEPQTYNAYYSPSNNEIVIPGCNILVPGYEHVLADDAILYAIIGSTFGHEITHGFDDQGCKYDEKGNMNNWWKAEDSIRFYGRTKSIVKQFNSFIAVDTLHIKGEQTQGENIADLAGVMLSFEAFKNTSQFQNHEIIAGLNPDQRFFLGYALGWMVNQRPEEIASRIRSDVHSPCKFRVNGPLSNVPEFYSAFGVKKGDALWRDDTLRIKIW